MQFTVDYDEQVTNAAVNTFVKRRLLDGLGRLGLFALVMTTAGLAYLLWQGDRSWFVGVIGTVLILVILVFVLLWQWRHAEMRRKLAAIPGRQGTVTLSEDGITIASEAGAMSSPWTAFTELWVLEHCWLLFLAPNNFVTLPTEGVPEDALAYLEAHLPDSCLRD